MTDNIISKSTIEQVYKEYQTRYNISLPIIQNINYINDDGFWAKFNTGDLYNKEYILHINNDLVDKNKKFIKQVLFHEFTHLSDSLLFLHETLKNFTDIMNSYSEFHASKREMIERIEEVGENDITLQTEITHIGILTIDSFMDQSFNFMYRDLIKMSNNNSESNLFYDTNHIYYFYGYLSALKYFGVNYLVKIYEIPADFLIDIENIQKMLLDDTVNIDDIKSTYQKLVENIKKQCAFNQIMNNFKKRT